MYASYNYNQRDLTKTDEGFIQGLHEQFGIFYLVPEGGANFYGLTGCQEIVTENPEDFE